MPEIYQRFDLDLEAMTKLGHEKLLELNLPKAGRTLRQGLIQNGYIVLESNESFSGIPHSVIVGGDFGKNHKGDFYELTERLGLQYRSEAFYTQRNGTD